MRFECQQCDNIMRVPGHAAGKSITCKVCGTKQRIPGPGSIRVLTSDKQRKPVRSIAAFVWLGIGLVLLVVGGFMITWLIDMDQSPPDPWDSIGRLFEDDQLRVEVLDVRRGPIKTEVLPGKVLESDMDILEIQVKVTNKSESDRMSYTDTQSTIITSGGPSLEDENGEVILPIDLAGIARVGTGRERPKEIPPGESLNGMYHFELPLRSADELRFTIPRSNFGQNSGKVELKYPTSAIHQK